MPTHFHAKIDWGDAETEIEVTHRCSENIVTTTTVTTHSDRLPCSPGTPPSSVTSSSRRSTSSVSNASGPPSQLSGRHRRSHSPEVSLPASSQRSQGSHPASPCPDIAIQRSGIPSPDEIIQPARVGTNKFYVVLCGTHVGIFGDWYGQVQPYTHWISGSHQVSYTNFDDALAAYTAAYLGQGPRLQVLQGPENLAIDLSGMFIGRR
ncbi:hypothetical protein GYMLUDRAFT_247604 [Collybiopsis luxurians FD-317 M1]|uniref:Uncharacterized protein n=1 Tax=Collybiopsis luxurians FD-317 M1 TaxID=944289 RepID=A0A0D0CFF1_9AGAR|nr:hypothetical protein GYMLUDRAFT_247604 [Collybiopsis luxurians FD-317 M1]